MSGPRFPNVPDTGGVPPVYRNGSNPIDDPQAAPLASNDTAGVAASDQPTWAILDENGFSVLDVDSLVDLTPSREQRISTFPVEQGGFQSYNKVAVPGEVRINVTKGGSNSDRQTFFFELDALLQTIDVCNIVTPDTTYSSYNLTRYEYPRRADKGKELVTVDLIFEEIRQSASGAFTQSQQPQGNDPVNDGPVQGVAPTGAQTPPGDPT